MAPDTSIPLMEQLRIATRELHERLGSLGYFQALLNHTLPLESYVGQLARWQSSTASWNNSCRAWINR